MNFFNLSKLVISKLILATLVILLPIGSALASDNNEMPKRYTDIQKDGLKGPVKSCMDVIGQGFDLTITYNKERMRSNVNVGKIFQYEYKYDEKGRVITDRKYDFANKTATSYSDSTKYVYKLNESGFETEIISQNKTGETTISEFSDTGLKTKQIKINRLGDIEDVTIYSYNEHAYKTSQLVYKPVEKTQMVSLDKFKLIQKDEYIYNDDLLIKILRTDDKGNSYIYKSYRYELFDKYGNWVRSYEATANKKEETKVRKIEYYE